MVSLWLLGLSAACGQDDGVEPPPQVPTSITISPPTSTLESLGETVQLTATVRTQSGQVMTGVSLTWSSSDASVADVRDGGLVTAAGNGVATVQASAGTTTGSAEITVRQRAVGISVSPSTHTLVALGDTVRLAASARDANGHSVAGFTFTWESEDEAVATVDSAGLATAVANGMTAVTASNGQVTGTATVSVMQRPTSLQIVSGNNQRGVFEQKLPEPLVVRIDDPGGAGVAGVPITFAPGAESGSVSSAQVATGTDGRASTEWTLGFGDTQSVSVSAPGNLRAMFSAEASSGLYECGAGYPPRRVLDLPLRAIHASGNWGTNETVVSEWTGTAPLVPPDYIAWLKSLHVNWVGLSIAIFVEDSMDATVERVYDAGGTFPDAVVRQFVRDLRAHGLNVYITLAFEDHISENAARPVKRWQLGFPGDPGRRPGRRPDPARALAMATRPPRPRPLRCRVLGDVHPAGGSFREDRRRRGSGTVLARHGDRPAIPHAPVAGPFGQRLPGRARGHGRTRPRGVRWGAELRPALGRAADPGRLRPGEPLPLAGSRSRRGRGECVVSARRVAALGGRERRHAGGRL